MSNLELTGQQLSVSELGEVDEAPMPSAGVRVRPRVQPMALPSTATPQAARLPAANRVETEKGGVQVVKAPPYETKKRSIAKAVSWRLIATLITATVVYLTTGEPKAAGAIALIDTTVKFGAYFFHERAWLRINFGRYRYTDYQI